MLRNPKEEIFFEIACIQIIKKLKLNITHIFQVNISLSYIDGLLPSHSAKAAANACLIGLETSNKEHAWQQVASRILNKRKLYENM
jgi:hypothetical protein